MTPAQVDRVRELAAAGRSDREVAEDLGVSWRTVLRARTRHGIPSAWTPTLSGCGSAGAYKRGCRCPVCRTAHSARLAAGRADRYARRAAGTATFTHGASAYKNWGCRCSVCCRAGHLDNAQYRARRARSGSAQ
ncbi:hypothetical protein [Streptomyces sp. NPDC059783]|uniref:hypothetical protein n=1 Tax=Streptomyces sp. NPDC059783 TaxID=3346944 RepID=UPI00365835F0